MRFRGDWIAYRILARLLVTECQLRIMLEET